MPQLIATAQGVEVLHVFLHKDRTILGRRPGSDIVLDSMAVSGHHCAFDLSGVAEVHVEDLGSTNGTYINNRIARGRTRLRDGDILAVGPYRLHYLQASAAPSGFGTTHAMQLQPQAPQLHASFRVMGGSAAGLEVPVVKAVTTFGKPGVAVVAVAHRRTGFFVTRLAGEQPPLLNDRPLGDDPVLLSDQDILQLAGTRMLFQLRE